MRFGFRASTVGLGLLLLGSGCASRRPVRFVSIPPPTAQALSLLGDTLWNLPLEPDQGPRLIRELSAAREAAAREPLNMSARIHLARRTAAVGRFREAIGVYTEAIAADPHDPRLTRRRGEILLRIRELDNAVADLRRAVQGAVTQWADIELNELPDGSGLYETTLRFSAFFHLGVTYYLQADFGQARHVLLEAVRHAHSADDQARAALWLFFAAWRGGGQTEARAILAQIDADLPVHGAVPELELLLAFKGDLPTDSLPVDPSQAMVTESDAMYGYGIGFGLLMLSRTEEARLVFDRVRETRDWSALPYIAAEMELAHMRRPEHPNRFQELP